MAKDIQLYDHTGAVKLFPKTHSELVITRAGHTVSTALELLGREITDIDSKVDGEVTKINGELTTINSTLDNHEGRIATLEENAVIKDGSITTSKLADHSVTWEKLGYDVRDDVNGLEGRIAELEENAVISDGSITTSKLADHSVTWEKLGLDVRDDVNGLEGRIADLEENAIIKDGSITTEKIADYSITEAKIATGAVSKNKLAEDSVTSSKIKDHAVEWDKLSVPVQTNIDNKAEKSEVEALTITVNTNTLNITELGDRVTEFEENITSDLNNLDDKVEDYLELSLKIVELTQAEYDAMEIYDYNTIYQITDTPNSYDNKLVTLENRINQLEEILSNNGLL